MKMLISRMLLATSVVLAIQVAAEPADARKSRAAPQPRDGVEVQSRRVTVGPNCVRAGDRVIGCDPDPFIRGEILRHYYSGWPD